MSGQERFDAAQQSAAARRIEEAEQGYRAADEAGHPSAPAMLGILAEARNDRAGAEAAYRRADERGDGLGSLRLGLMLAGSDHWPEARAAFARADERGRLEPPQPLLSLLAAGGAEGLMDPEGSASRGYRTSPLASPVLVGAVTVLVLLVAVFLSYNANRGLPFVPTRELKLDIGNGSNLVVGNDVREGGFRIGLISALKPVVLPSGVPGAQLTLQLDQAHSNVPVDTTATILSRSVLGLKFVSLNLGSDKRFFGDGAVIPVARTSVPVQFDDVYRIFDRPTRSAIQTNLVGFGDALTGRGSSLNDTIHSLPSLLGYLEPVARYLTQPRTGLSRFFVDTEQFMSVVAPIAGVNAQLFGDMATTFAAIDRYPDRYKLTIAKSPSTLDVATVSLRAQLPFLRDFASFARTLDPGVTELRNALPNVTPAIEIGTRTLARTPALNRELQGVFVALKNLAMQPGTQIGLNGLASTVGILNPMIRYLGPFVTVCNTWNYWWTYLAEHISEKNQYGFAQRVILNTADGTQQDNVGSLPASAPANGQGGGKEFLHAPSYGAAITTNGAADCENAQRGYVKKLNAADPLGRNLQTDPHTPGAQGTTWSGISSVPPGETFTRSPQTGPQLGLNPSNP